MTDKIIENMKERENCNETDSSLGSPELEVSLYNDFDPSYILLGLT